MFGLFKKRQQAQPADEAHPQHRNFARIFISDGLRRQRNRFLTLLIDARASQVLQEAWHNFGAKVLPVESLTPPAGWSVSAFRHEKHLCILIIFPPPQAAGESYFGFIVAGPSDDWSAEGGAPVPARYFLLERSASDAPTIFEWRSSSAEDEWVFDSHGPGPSPLHPPDFAGIILSRFYGFKLGA